MIVKSSVRKNEYRDSIQLMRISNEIAGIKGVKNAAVLMATDTNKKVLSDAGLLTAEIKKAGPNDLVFAVSSDDKGAIKKAFDRLEQLLGTKR
jgi:predicted HTH transcriptional regulator